MKILITEDYEQMSRHAARILASQLTLKPDSVLGLATGGTVTGMYQRLIALHREDGLDFSQAQAFNLDEYLPIAPEDPQSYHTFMQTHLFSQVNFSAGSTHIPNGLAADAEAECRRYEASIEAAGGIDIQVLGIGRNGHIGFNEPDITFEAGTHQVTLDEQTLLDNARFFPSVAAVPKRAISMGIKTIMHARRILLLASGLEKSDAVHRMINGKITPALPASILQLHPDVILVIDRDAAALLPEGLRTSGSVAKEAQHV